MVSIASEYMLYIMESESHSLFIYSKRDYITVKIVSTDGPIVGSLCDFAGVLFLKCEIFILFQGLGNTASPKARSMQPCPTQI